jgi:hypothetical protein
MAYPTYWPANGWAVPDKWNKADPNDPDNTRFFDLWADDLLAITDDAVHLADLDPNGPFFQGIANYVQGSVAVKKVTTSYTHESAFPMSFIKKRADDKLPAKRNYVKELFGGDRLKAGSVVVDKVRVVKIHTVWARYEACQTEFRTYFNAKPAALIGGAPLTHIHWAHLPIPIAGTPYTIPVVDRNIGECWLFQGQAKSSAKLIVQNGFNPFYGAPYTTTTGYGAMGKGLYFSDQFEKAAQYTLCPKQNCRATKKCHCTKKDGSPVSRTLLLSRVLLGDPYILNKHNKDSLRHGNNFELARTTNGGFTDQVDARSRANNAIAGYSSAFGQGKFNDVLANKKRYGGKNHPMVRAVSRNAGVFSSNEFLVRMGAQAYPEFIVYFHYN